MTATVPKYCSSHDLIISAAPPDKRTAWACRVNDCQTPLILIRKLYTIYWCPRGIMPVVCCVAQYLPTKIWNVAGRGSAIAFSQSFYPWSQFISVQRPRIAFKLFYFDSYSQFARRNGNTPAFVCVGLQSQFGVQQDTLCNGLISWPPQLPQIAQFIRASQPSRRTCWLFIIVSPSFPLVRDNQPG